MTFILYSSYGKFFLLETLLVLDLRSTMNRAFTGSNRLLFAVYICMHACMHGG